MEEKLIESVELKIPEIKIQEAEMDVKVCFEELSKARYTFLRQQEELKNAAIELKILEGKIRFVREVDIPSIREKISNMKLFTDKLERRLKEITDYEGKKK